MHPPPLRLDHRLSDWPECCLEVHCCKGTVMFPTKLLIERHGDRTLVAVLKNQRCSHCGKPPAPVHLCAGWHRSHVGGAAPDWAIELVPEPRPGR
jgi:hypothetical protein